MILDNGKLKTDELEAMKDLVSGFKILNGTYDEIPEPKHIITETIGECVFPNSIDFKDKDQNNIINIKIDDSYWTKLHDDREER